MEQNPNNKTAYWIYTKVYDDTPIPQRPAAEKLPPALLAARSLERPGAYSWQSKESIFLKQARLLAQYEDTYEFSEPVVRYYPTYQALTDRQLRGYFSWRTRLRRGQLELAPASFAYLYIYELLHLIGVSGPAEGFEKLQQFGRDYSAFDKSILIYLRRWLRDFAVYYRLDPRLLADTPEVTYHQSVAVLMELPSRSQEQVVTAVRQLAPKWLGRSKFYAAYRQDYERVIFQVLLGMHQHYDRNSTRPLTEQFFGKVTLTPVRLFENAVFCNPLKNRTFEYHLDALCVFHCQNDQWSVRRLPPGTFGADRMEELTKTVDALMREEYGYAHPIKAPLSTKWLCKLIRQQAQALLEEQKASQAKKLVIDYSQLSRIRQEAAQTRDKLAVEDEEAELLPPPAPTPPTQTPAQDLPAGLLPEEYRLLQCLLYGGDLSWIQSQGLMSAVLADSINEKLYDTFADAVLEDGPAVISDYCDSLKEMIGP